MEGSSDLMEGSSSMASKPTDVFLCPICREVLYKPVALVCGHALCFWCAHKSMSRIGVSTCPFCRDPYSYFPEICQKLHLLLWKIDPAAQKRRREENLGMEETIRIQSTKVEDPEVPQSHKPQVADASCDKCKQLVFRPCALHCGHVHCEKCIPKGDGVITCPSCQGQHLSGTPKLFLGLHLYLKGVFPEEYAARGETQALLPDEYEGSASKKQKNSDWTSGKDYHVGVGCDHCGMYPLRGDRYKCVECKEDIGFDLCTKCHESRESNLKLGRFNQQHNPNHTFEVLKSGVARNLMFTLLSPPVLPVLPVPMVASPGDEEPGDEAAEEPESAESGDEEESEGAESGDEEESESAESRDEEESEDAESGDEEESEGAESDDEEAVDSGGD